MSPRSIVAALACSLALAAPTCAGDAPPEETLARDIEACVRARNPASLSDLCDIEANLRRSGFADPDLRDLRDRMVAEGEKTGAFFGFALDNARKGGTFKFLRLRAADGERRPVFRLLHPDDEVNYVELAVAAGKVVDAYNYGTGDWIWSRGTTRRSSPSSPGCPKKRAR